MPETPPNLRPDAFSGVAEDYLRYRPPYPAAMVDSLVAETTSGPGETAIDLACGPGRLTFALAPRFETVLAVDLEPQMIALAEAEAVRRGVGNVRWSVGPAEAFEAPAGTASLVTVGEAFHRLDRPRVAAAAYGWLKPGGVFVTLGGADFLAGDAPWRKALAELARAWFHRDAAPAPTKSGLAEHERAIAAAGFVDIADRDFAVEREWTLAELLGYFRSTSVLSRHALGERHAAFEAAVTTLLTGYDPSSRYRETMSFGYTVARKP